MRYRTMWSAIIQQKQIYNQIDYICVNSNIITKHQHFLIDAQSHNGMTFSSDHKLVISVMDLSALYRLAQQQREEASKRQYDPPLIRDNKTRQIYCTHITQTLQEVDINHKTPQEQYEIIKEAIYKATTT